VSAKFFSMLMSLCVANIKSGRATLADAYGVMQRCRDAGVVPDTIVYNALLAAVSQEAGRGRASLADATSAMRQLRSEGLRPDVRTMNTLMDVTAKVAASKIDGDVFGDDEPVPVTPMSGQSILRLMQAEGLEPNVWTFTSLFSMYARCAARGPGQVSLGDANKVLRQMLHVRVEPTVPFINSYMTLVAKLALHGEALLEDGYGVLKYAKEYNLAPSVVTMNALADVGACSAARGKASFADILDILDKLPLQGIKADGITFNTVLNALAHTAADRKLRDPVQKALDLVARMEREGVDPDVVTYSSVLNVCAKAIEAGRATVQDADEIMHRMRNRQLLAGILKSQCFRQFTW
jgi:hypothetical protein